MNYISIKNPDASMYLDEVDRSFGVFRKAPHMVPKRCPDGETFIYKMENISDEGQDDLREIKALVF